MVPSRESPDERTARWSAEVEALRGRGFTAPGVLAEVALADVVERYGYLEPLDRLTRAEARAAVRAGRVIGFRQERNMGGGDVFVVDVGRERGATLAYVLPEPLRADDVAAALATNPWESLADLVGWLDERRAIARGGDAAG